MGVARRAANRSQHFKMELQNWVGSLHDNTMKVMDVAEAKVGRLMELDIENAGMSQETVDDFQRNGQETVILCFKGEAKNCVSNPERSGFRAWEQMARHLDPRTGRRQVCCIRPSNTPGQSEWTDIIKTQDAHRADVGTRGGRI